MTETVTLYKCSECKKIITDPKGGVVVHGNIYVADPEKLGGLVGDNFPKPDEAQLSVVSNVVKRTAFCVPCFLNVVLPDAKLTSTR